MWTTLKKRCPHAQNPNKCKCQPRNNIDQEATLASPHSAHHSQAPRQPAHRFPRGGRIIDDHDARRPPARGQRIAEKRGFENAEKRRTDLLFLLALTLAVLQPNGRLL